MFGMRPAFPSLRSLVKSETTNRSSAERTADCFEGAICVDLLAIEEKSQQLMMVNVRFDGDFVPYLLCSEKMRYLKNALFEKSQVSDPKRSFGSPARRVAEPSGTVSEPAPRDFRMVRRWSPDGFRAVTDTSQILIG